MTTKKARYKRDLLGSETQIRVLLLGVGASAFLPEFRKRQIFTAEQPEVLKDHFYDTLIRTPDGVVFATQSGDLEFLTEETNAISTCVPLFLEGDAAKRRGDG